MNRVWREDAWLIVGFEYLGGVRHKWESVRSLDELGQSRHPVMASGHGSRAVYRGSSTGMATGIATAPLNAMVNLLAASASQCAPATPVRCVLMTLEGGRSAVDAARLNAMTILGSTQGFVA